MTIPGVSTIGVIGAGNIGSSVARAVIGAGYDVVIANSRGPETLTELIAQLGPQARAATAREAGEAAELVVVAVPLQAIDDVPVEPLAGKTVIDANNYYSARDGQIAALDTHQTTSSQLLQDRLPEARVVKGFNHIMAGQIVGDAQQSGGSNRRALALFTDDDEARAQVHRLFDEIGFDPVDGGTLADSWRIEPGAPGYGPRLDAVALTAALAAAERFPG